MAWTTVFSPAKLNLFLELVDRRADGYHELDTVMTKVSLADRISFRLRHDDQIRLIQHPGPRSAAQSLPLDQSNLIWKALDALRAAAGGLPGIDVAIDKRIPQQAGLGGGSSNAVTTLLTVNRLAGLDLPTTRLQDLANQLGSDLAFFFSSAAARCRGRGEQVTELPGFRRFWAVIGMPPGGLSTASVFSAAELPESRCRGDLLYQGWPTLSLPRLARQMFNRLQEAASGLNPWIRKLQMEFALAGCPGHQISGSGSSYFGIFAGRRQALQVAKRLRARVPQARFFAVTTVRTSTGPVRGIPD